MPPISIVILTFNSEDVIAQTLSAASQVSDDIQVVDSYSTDSTVAIVESNGFHVVQRPFHSYTDQRNWAIDNLPLRHPWQLHVDADEAISQGLVTELVDLFAAGDPPYNAYAIPRLIRFLGRDLRHGGLYPIYHLRLFRHGHGRCESRQYDQHFVSPDRIGHLRNPLIDDHRSSLAEWTRRHNKWSDAEVEELLGQIRRDEIGLAPSIARRRRGRRLYYSMPRFFRVFALTAYRYLLRGGFFDGTEGLIYHVLQGFWFRFLIDAKLYECEQTQNKPR